MIRELGQSTSDLEDHMDKSAAKHGHHMDKLHDKLLDLLQDKNQQLAVKLEDLKNRSRHSNLRF